MGAGASLHHPADRTSLPLTKMKEQNTAALFMGSAVGLRAGCAALSVPQENPGFGPVSPKSQREGKELTMEREQTPKFTFSKYN